ncbi:MAG: DUF1957 domain-containing protein [Bacillota bacterium]|nr:DUF1957 domain-containing protein [Bacillota bacterium]
MTQGYLAFVLHAHLPYVRHPEHTTSLEERWLWETLTESYIPLLQCFLRLANKGIPFRVTVSLSPPLISMLADPLLQERYLKYLDLSLALGRREIERNREQAEFLRLAEFYVERLEDIKRFYCDKWDRNILQAFRHLAEAGCLELITCAATHGYLPLMATEEGRRAQIAIALELFEHYFGFTPDGFWLPECGYLPGVDRILADYGIKYFFTETHGILNASPLPSHGACVPLLTPAGVAAFGRDPESSRQVWSAREGYPGDYYYREFYRDIGYDLDHSYLAPYLNTGGVRVDTGFKYYRITGERKEKEVYDPGRARERACVHAGNFLFNREKQIEYLKEKVSPQKPLVVAPYDAELFGHWWFEGPLWLEEFLARVPLQQTFSLCTPGDYLKQGPALESGEIPQCSWGLRGYHEVWLGPSNDWIYRHLHRAEKCMVELARTYPSALGTRRRALNQAARELLLAQSSDWPFIMHTKTVVGYAKQRLQDHLGRFQVLYRQLKHNCLDQEFLTRVERLDPIFPQLDYRIYAGGPGKREISTGTKAVSSHKPGAVLMLSWEYPPRSVGGLGRHVDGLSRALAALGYRVHILAPWVPGVPELEQRGPLLIHRLKFPSLQGGDFLDWVFQFNAALAAYAGKLIQDRPEIDMIHAHDWLVAYAAVALKQIHHLPLVVTIHATEHGRNRGIFTLLQEKIHHLEWELTFEAWRVICCSQFMRQEIENLFQVPSDKIDVIPNGIEEICFRPGLLLNQGLRLSYTLQGEKIIFYVGRLVPEKGVQTLLEAVPLVLSEFPGVRLIIGGQGPYGWELQCQAKRLGIEENVVFTGFIDDHLKNHLYREAAVAVIPSFYEPFGIVALEAMAAGVPVIVSDVGGLREIVAHQVDGWRVPAGDARALAEVIKQVLGNEEKARAVALRGLNRAREYRWSRVARETAGIYQRVRNEARLNPWAYLPREAQVFCGGN